jgi:hypothetical protein
MTQLEALKDYFKSRTSITQKYAMDNLGLMRLSERVRELEQQGYQFSHNMIKVDSRYGSARVAEYVLLEAPQ